MRWLKSLEINSHLSILELYDNWGGGAEEKKLEEKKLVINRWVSSGSCLSRSKKGKFIHNDLRYISYRETVLVLRKIKYTLCISLPGEIKYCKIRYYV